jgi:drug/metabolite transporter (DMT)-like permease
MQAVTWNYIFAILLAVVFFKPQFGLVQIDNYGVYITLGILLPVVFWILAKSIRTTGIARTDIAQRLSLIIPMLAAYFLFKEQFSPLKIGGIVLGMIAVSLILSFKPTENSKSPSYIYPMLVFLGFGCIDVLFKKVALIQSIPYTTSLVAVFCCSAVVALTGTLYFVFVKKERLQLINIVCGAILGCFNFGNIYFYLKAHQAYAAHPSTVFATMNIGVISVGCLIGVFLFKEKLNAYNSVGIVLALTAVILIALS